MFHLGWFLQGSSVQAWGEPFTGAIGRDWRQPEFFVDLARHLERGRFDYVLIEDSSYVGESYGNSRELYLHQGEAVFAFEVETSTPITTGIDRFMELLEIFPNLAKNIVLIIPPKRLNKMNKLLKDSHYIGHPLYMENKLVYSFTNQIADIYNLLSQRSNLTLEDIFREITKILISPL